MISISKQYYRYNNTIWTMPFKPPTVFYDHFIIVIGPGVISLINRHRQKFLYQIGSCIRSGAVMSGKEGSRRVCIILWFYVVILYYYFIDIYCLLFTLIFFVFYIAIIGITIIFHSFLPWLFVSFRRIF